MFSCSRCCRLFLPLREALFLRMPLAEAACRGACGSTLPLVPRDEDTRLAAVVVLLHKQGGVGRPVSTCFDKLADPKERAQRARTGTLPRGYPVQLGAVRRV